MGLFQKFIDKSITENLEHIFPKETIKQSMIGFIDTPTEPEYPTRRWTAELMLS